MNTTDMVKSHTGDAGNGAMAAALTKAVAVPAKKKVAVPTVATDPNGNLPDLSASPALSEAEIEKAAEAAARKKVWAEQAGGALRGLKDRKEKICAIPGWELEASLAKEVAALTAKIKEIETAGDENLHRHVGFSAFLNDIRAVEAPEQMDAVVGRITDEKVNDNGTTRYQAARKDEVHRLKSAGMLPQGAFCWREQWYLPYEPFDGEVKSSAQKAVEAEVTKAIRRLWDVKKKANRKKSEELRSLPANNDLSGILDNVAGLYRVECAPVRDKKNPKKVIRHGGVAIVRLSDRGKKGNSFFLIEPIDGAGCFDWLVGERGWWLSVPNAIFCKVSEKTPSDVRDKALRLASALNKVLFPLWKARKEAGAGE